jgi:hypothetical protein
MLFGDWLTQFRSSIRLGSLKRHARRRWQNGEGALCVVDLAQRHRLAD